MPSSTNIVTDVASSQGTSLIAGARKISIKQSRASTTSKLDASILSLPHGSDRVYEDGLTDKGASGETDGITVTVSAEGLGSPPGAGATVNAGGKECKCIESSTDSNAGELQAWSASYTSDYPKT